jgi:hypothetical protein
MKYYFFLLLIELIQHQIIFDEMNYVHSKAHVHIIPTKWMRGSLSVFIVLQRHIFAITAHSNSDDSRCAHRPLHQILFLLIGGYFKTKRTTDNKQTKGYICCITESAIMRPGLQLGRFFRRKSNPRGISGAFQENGRRICAICDFNRPG